MKLIRHLTGRGVAAIGALGLICTAIYGAPEPATAETATLAPTHEADGLHDPTELFFEDFEVQGSGTHSLESYAGSTGATYTADTYYLSAEHCNGFITSFDQSTKPDGHCKSVGQWNFVRQKAYALGLLTDTPETNRAVSSNTNNAMRSESGDLVPIAKQRMLATTAPLDIRETKNRFITASVDYAATSCHFAHPLLRLSLVTDENNELPISENAIDPCSDQRSETISSPISPDGDIYYGRFPADSAILLDSDHLGVVLRNDQGEHEGNDGAFDNIRLLDATPQLTKSFGPDTVHFGETSTLTLEVSNTSDLGAKRGWSFDDQLPEGLTVADAPAQGGTCRAVVTAAPGSSTISVTDGTLNAGDRTCTITVDVTASAPTGGDAEPASFENCAANIAEPVGIDLPECAEVTFTPAPEDDADPDGDDTLDGDSDPTAGTASDPTNDASTDADPSAEAQDDAEADTDPKAEADTGSGPKADSEAATDADSDPKAAADTDSDPTSEAAADAGSGSDARSEADSDADAADADGPGNPKGAEADTAASADGSSTAGTSTASGTDGNGSSNDGHLPRTGANGAASVGLAGAVLVAAGALAVAAARRRRNDA
ncbi:LPXTG cell wall anchor domain-containing protein [Brevibacterium oceani]|uniref:DUF7933 domain-containing protein n=1 Tax=Brevibacterium oceani TaxID=358099 RepID=UPI001B3393E5|nr:LPXTG cell wall anchor domain-containing protein [Brevibacterium oceani]